MKPKKSLFDFPADGNRRSRFWHNMAAIMLAGITLSANRADAQSLGKILQLPAPPKMCAGGNCPSFPPGHYRAGTGVAIFEVVGNYARISPYLNREAAALKFPDAAFDQMPEDVAAWVPASHLLLPPKLAKKYGIEQADPNAPVEKDADKEEKLLAAAERREAEKKRLAEKAAKLALSPRGVDDEMVDEPANEPERVEAGAGDENRGIVALQLDEAELPPTPEPDSVIEMKIIEGSAKAEPVERTDVADQIIEENQNAKAQAKPDNVIDMVLAEPAAKAGLEKNTETGEVVFLDDTSGNTGNEDAATIEQETTQENAETVSNNVSVLARMQASDGAKEPMALREVKSTDLVALNPLRKDEAEQSPAEQETGNQAKDDSRAKDQIESQIAALPEKLSGELLDARLDKLPRRPALGLTMADIVLIRTKALAMLKSGECGSIRGGGLAPTTGFLFVQCDDILMGSGFEQFKRPGQ